jgi:Arc/MetJ-type ribon-helix-helix transcriptional regulator
MRAANAKLKRYNLTLPESTVERIATIREETEASSDSEVVRRAIRLYERLLKDSVEIVIQDKTGNKHTVLPETL